MPKCECYESIKKDTDGVWSNPKRYDKMDNQQPSLE